MTNYGSFNRRQVLKAGLAGAAWAAIGRHLASVSLAAARVSAGADGKPRHPNIVLIMADDMGYSDIGCYGGEVQTPNIDRLAAGGVRFTQVYNNARCCPTRASLLTGLYPHQAGVGHMLTDTGLPGYTPCLNDQCITIAESLRRAGYMTLMSGKWHVGDKVGHRPSERGFDHSVALTSGGSSYWKTTLCHDGEVVKHEDKDFYMTDCFTSSAVDLIDKHGRGEKPFFLYLTYTSPHWPLHAWPDDIKKYAELYKTGWDKLRKARYERMVKNGIIDSKWKLTEQDSPAWDSLEQAKKDDYANRMAVYAAQIDRMDQGIGKVLAKIKEIGAEQDTLVLFLADNGGCAEIIDRGTKGVPAGPMGSFLSYGKSWANMSNTPFVKYKHWVHEGGISTPLIAYWPSVIAAGAAVKPGGMIGDFGHIIDIMPTCLDAAGAEQRTPLKSADGKEKPVLPLEGASLLPLLKGKPRTAPAEYFWEHEGNRAVRQGKWKLVAEHNHDWSLYDMEADRSETSDLAEKNADKVKELSEKYDAWAKRCNVAPWKDVQKTIRIKEQASKPASRPAPTPVPMD